jgi:hypothetical protein
MGVAVGVAMGVAVGVAMGVAVGVAMGVAVGVAMGVAVGVAMGVAVGVVMTEVVGMATSIVAEGIGNSPEEDVDISPNVDIERVVLATKKVTVVGRIVEEERSRFKFITTLPLEQIINIRSLTSKDGLVSTEYSSEILGSPQSNLFPESWLHEKGNTIVKAVSDIHNFLTLYSAMARL